MPRVKALKPRTWATFQEVTEEVYWDPIAVQELMLAAADEALESIHANGYEELSQPVTSIDPVMIPYIDPVTGQTIVAVIVAKVRCMFKLGPQHA